MTTKIADMVCGSASPVEKLFAFLATAGYYSTDNFTCIHSSSPGIMQLLMRLHRRLPVELFFWVAGLFYLASINPDGEGVLSLCALHAIGFPCPGCGLGASLSYLMHGELTRAFASHPLGLFALPVIIHRIVVLLKQMLLSLPHQTLKGQTNA
jgi:hypothetical protein